MYYNKWDNDGGQDVFVKRSTLNKISKAYYPEFYNDGTKKYVIAYDPSSKLDNSEVLIGELFRDEEKGLMLKLVNLINLIEVRRNGEKVIIQKPKQIEKIKQLMLNYNRGYVDYEGLPHVFFDAGSGGGGFDVAQFLLPDWHDDKGKLHRGIIDKEDDYMKLVEDDYEGAADILTLFNFKADKVAAYQRLQDACNQGLIIFPQDLNARGELEFEQVDSEGNINIKYEKIKDKEELASLIEFSLLKEELIGMQKTKNQNGTVKFDLSPEAQQRNLHD